MATAAVEAEAAGEMAEGPEAGGAAWGNCDACKEASLHIEGRASEAEEAAMVKLAGSPCASSFLNNATMRWLPHRHIVIARTA